MAAYASLLSLTSVIEEIRHHPCPPITLDNQLAGSLARNLGFLQDFLEAYSDVATEADGLEGRIADAAYAAEDVIENHIVDQLGLVSTSQGAAEAERFHRDLQKVALDMDSVTKEAMEIKKKLPNNQDQKLHGSFLRDTSKRPPLVTQQNIMVGFDGILNEVLDKLTGDQLSRQVIAVVGMGGSGKTTLTKNAYENELVKQHFDIRVWLTISQHYNLREIFLKFLVEQTSNGSREYLSQLSEEEAGNKLYKILYGRRYLVALDDMWSIEAWDGVNRVFPNNYNGSRIIITTRLSTVASKFSESIKMNFLDENDSWDLLSKIVFGEEACPEELEESGRKIAGDCRGLPLSVAVISGLLAKSKGTLESWVSVAEKLNSSLVLEKEEHCSQILHSSYDHMPIHLKPCFLYMGVFAEDGEISTSTLTKLWIAEGFVKASSDKTLEMVAYEYLLELVDRNLILAKRIGSSGKIKTCIAHDLIRDLCIRQAEEERFKFTWKYNLGIGQGSYALRRRLTIHESTLKEEHHQYQDFYVMKSASLAHSFTLDLLFPPEYISRLLRVFIGKFALLPVSHWTVFLDAIFHLVNLRLIVCSNRIAFRFKLPSSLHCLWNLQTLILESFYDMQLDIWKMHRLRHVKGDRIYLLDPPLSRQADKHDHEFVLWNLQSLSLVYNFKCGVEVVRRIPNIRTLKFSFQDNFADFSGCFLDNLHKLESLTCDFGFTVRSMSVFRQNFSLPQSIIKLVLCRIDLDWEYLNTEIGSLPFLQVLKLRNCYCGWKWDSVEGKFPCLRVLSIFGLTDLEDWTVQSSHFPCLEHLHLTGLSKLNEIPSEIGDIPNLKQIELRRCSKSVVQSVQKILDEQSELGNVDLKVSVLDN